MLRKWFAILLCLCLFPFGCIGEKSCGCFEYEVLPNGTAVITRYTGEEGRVLELPSSLDDLKVSRIGDYAFAYSSLENIIIPEGVLEIGACAFNACYRLTDIRLPSTLKRIEADAFLCCTALEQISFPKELQYLGDEAFYNCQNLKTATVPDSTQMGVRVFEACYLLGVNP